MAKVSAQRYKRKRNTSLGYSTKLSKSYVQRRPFFIKDNRKPNNSQANI